MGTHCLIEPIVDAARQRNGGFRIEILEPRHRMRQHLQVDSGLVHFLQAQFADIVEACTVAGAAIASKPRACCFTSGS